MGPSGCWDLGASHFDLCHLWLCCTSGQRADPAPSPEGLWDPPIQCPSSWNTQLSQCTEHRPGKEEEHKVCRANGIGFILRHCLFIHIRFLLLRLRDILCIRSCMGVDNLRCPAFRHLLRPPPPRLLPHYQIWPPCDLLAYQGLGGICSFGAN